MTEARRTAAGTPFVHLNAAGAGLMPSSVVTAIKRHLDLEAGRGAHWAMADAAPALAETRRQAAALFGVRETHVAFGDQASRLWAIAFSSIPLRKGDRVLIARNDWGGNILTALRRTAAAGAELVQIPMTDGATLDVESARSLIDERTAAICAATIASSSGVCQPVESLGALPRPAHCLYFVDAAQAAGRFPIDLPGAVADVMIAPARKWLRGGRGVAMMAVSDRALKLLGTPAIIDQASGVWEPTDEFAVHEDARRFETWEFSAAARLGLGAALQYLDGQGIDRVSAAITERVRCLRARMAGISGLVVCEPEDRIAEPAFVTLHHATVPAAEIARAMAESGVAIAAVGTDYARWDLAARGLEAVVRAAPHTYTSDQDIDLFADALASVVRALSARVPHRANPRTGIG